jgi:cyanophycinase-like exopeptidase
MLPPPDAGPATIVVIGGGVEEEGGWSDVPFTALGAGHTVAVLGTTAADQPGWYAAYFLARGARAADEYTIGTRADALAADLSAYDAFFLRDGDPAAYSSLWAGTPVEGALRAAAAIGGTGGGAVVLGGVDPAGDADGIDPADVLADWSDTRITFDSAFLPLLEGMLVDSHFTQRGRLGRLLPFAGCNGLAGLGVDDRTAAVFTGGAWAVYGAATATFVSGGTAVCGEGPPTVDDAVVDVLVDGWSWSATTGPTGPGEPRDAPYVAKAVTLADGTEGAWTLLHPRPDDLACGTLELSPGRAAWPGIATADAWNADVVEPLVGGTVWALARAGLPAAVLLPAGAEVDALAAGGFGGKGTRAAVVLVAEGGLRSDEGTSIDPGCTTPRFARALTGVRASVLAPGGDTFAGLGAAPAGDDTGAGADDTGVGATDGPANADSCGCAAPGPSTGGARFLALAAAVLLGTRARRAHGDGPGRV